MKDWVFNKESQHAESDADPHGTENDSSGKLTINIGENEEEVNVHYSWIDRIDDVYFNAITHLLQQKFIAVNMEGVLVGRSGKVSIVQVATRQHVFLFDILRMKSTCFDKGLGDVLENKEIVKVMHDCRKPSDLLFHLFGCKLVNVFDTQVADVIIYKNRNGGDIPRYVRGQVGCLMEYMNLTIDQVYFQRVRSKCIEIDQAVWLDRPLSLYLVEAAVKDVMYLLDLRKVLMECMMEEFTAAVDIYLKVIRDSPSETSKSLKANTSHLLPDEFHEMESNFRRQAARNHYRYQGIQNRDENGFRENYINNVDAGIIWSRDIWHEGSNFTAEQSTSSGFKGFRGRADTSPSTTQAMYLSPNQCPDMLEKLCESDSKSSSDDASTCDESLGDENETEVDNVEVNGNDTSKEKMETVCNHPKNQSMESSEMNKDSQENPVDIKSAVSLYESRNKISSNQLKKPQVEKMCEDVPWINGCDSDLKKYEENGVMSKVDSCSTHDDPENNGDASIKLEPSDWITCVKKKDDTHVFSSSLEVKPVDENMDHDALMAAFSTALGIDFGKLTLKENDVTISDSMQSDLKSGNMESEIDEKKVKTDQIIYGDHPLDLSVKKSIAEKKQIESGVHFTRNDVKDIKIVNVKTPKTMKMMGSNDTVTMEMKKKSDAVNDATIQMINVGSDATDNVTMEMMKDGNDAILISSGRASIHQQLTSSTPHVIKNDANKPASSSRLLQLPDDFSVSSTSSSSCSSSSSSDIFTSSEHDNTKIKDPFSDPVMQFHDLETVMSKDASWVPDKNLDLYVKYKSVVVDTATESDSSGTDSSSSSVNTDNREGQQEIKLIPAGKKILEDGKAVS
ncbi:uncharacterized protein LOC102808302 [Saccoglossus kowalevskii]